MFVAFFESIKYVGHLWPISLLRIFIGYVYFNQAIIKFKGDFLYRPIIAASISEWLPTSTAPEWYKLLLEQWVPEHWQFFAYFIVVCEFIIGISYMMGFFIRPVTILAFYLCLNNLIITPPDQIYFQQLQLAVILALGWLGAGRSLGFDYYFYKKKRGLWW